MRALVVYESMYGNTHVVASNIADGLRSDFEVTLVPVAEASQDLIADADLLLAGAPTHMHGMSSRSTRRMATEAAAKDGSGLRIEPDADGPGMRDWLKDLGHRDGLAATFDTRLSGVPALSPAPPTTAHSATSPAPSTTTPKPTAAPTGKPGGPTQVCSQADTYLRAVRTGEHSGYDRGVFQFSGRLPGYTVERVHAVYSDAKGTRSRWLGSPTCGWSSTARVRSARSRCTGPIPGPTVLTPYYPELLTVSAAGDFEGVLSFGIGLAAQGSYHVFTLTSPHRLMIDVSHVALGAFPGIWDITSWPQYWATQYSWLNGHQPWLSSPSSVVQVWAGGYGSASVGRQVNANTFTVTKPAGKTFTVTGVRPVSVPGPWVITKIA